MNPEKKHHTPLKFRDVPTPSRLEKSKKFILAKNNKSYFWRLCQTKIIDCFANKTSLNNVPGVAWLENGKLQKTPRAPLISNLDSLPMIPYELFPMENENDEQKLFRPHVVYKIYLAFIYVHDVPL